MVIELHQIPYDVLYTSTYSRVCDVYNVFRRAGKRQHMEFQLHLIAVQLEGKRRGHVGFTPTETRWQKLVDQRE